MHIVSVYLCIKEEMLGDKVRALPLAISIYMMYIYDIYIICMRFRGGPRCFVSEAWVSLSPCCRVF